MTAVGGVGPVSARSTVGDPVPAALRTPTSPFRSWPITAILLGYPLWWLLGLSAVIPVVLAVPMALQLIRKGRIRLPKGTAWWALFLVWALASSLMLWVDAPGAVAGGGMSRLLVYGYRLLWYAACTVVLVWLGNADAKAVPTKAVLDLVAWMFVITVAGGLLGTLVPTFELRSALETALPRGLANNSFVSDLVHPVAAARTTFLGYVQYRPMAPFSYANTWGASLAFTLPFFLVSWLRRGAGWRRLAAPFVLVAAAVPIVYSLNRALWGALLVGVAYGLVHLAVRGSTKMFVAALAVLVVAAGVFLASPLAGDIVVRLEHAHSNDRRGELLTVTERSVLQGSPVVGFGSTRDTLGGFASIAGGSTPDCPACGLPPLGTQGLLWTVLFAQGLGGLAFFVLFFLRRLRAHVRSRTPVESVAVAVILFFLITLLVYDTLGLPMMIVMIALGLAWRESAQERGEPDLALAVAASRVHAAWQSIAVCTCVGALVGGGIAVSMPATYAARATVLLAPVPVSLDPTAETRRRSGSITIDTEAALAVSADTLGALTTDPVVQANLRSRISVTAPPTTDVIVIEYRDTDPRTAEATASTVASAYLAVRADYLAARRDQALRTLDEQLAELVNSTPDSAQASKDTAAAEAKIRSYIDAIQLTPTSAGELLREPIAKHVRSQVEVPLVSSTLLGLLAGLLLAAATGWRRPSHVEIGVSGLRHAAVQRGVGESEEG